LRGRAAKSFERGNETDGFRIAGRGRALDQINAGKEGGLLIGLREMFDAGG